jgi:hypothetical protein
MCLPNLYPGTQGQVIGLLLPRFEPGPELTGRGRKPVRDQFAHDGTRDVNVSVGCLARRFELSGSCTEVVVLMPSRLREVANFRSGAPSKRAVRHAQTFF